MEHFRKESSALAVGRRRLATDRKKLTEEVRLKTILFNFEILYFLYVLISNLGVRV